MILFPGQLWLENPNRLRGFSIALQWRHNGHDGVSNYQPHDYLLNRLFGRRSKKASKLRATGLCTGNSPGTGEFPAQMTSKAENVSIWWPHHGKFTPHYTHGCNYSPMLWSQCCFSLICGDERDRGIFYHLQWNVTSCGSTFDINKPLGV